MRILWIIRQAGTAVAFKSAIKQFEDFENVVYAYPQAFAILELHQLEFNKISDSTSCSEVLETEKPLAIITGTSLEVLTDSNWWQEARKRKIYSFAYVDQWSRIESRILYDQVLSLPDFVLCFNEVVRDLISKFWPEQNNERLLVSGNPYHLDLQSQYKELKRNTDISSKNKLAILFPTEPSPYGTESKDEACFDCLVSSLIKLKEKSPRLDFKLNLKIHPNDSFDRIKKWNSRGIEIELLNKDSSPVAALCQSQMTVGMTSIILIESSLLEIPTISIQLEALEDMVIFHESQYLIYCNELMELVEHIRNSLSSHPFGLEYSEKEIAPHGKSSHFKNLVIKRICNN